MFCHTKRPLRLPCSPLVRLLVPDLDLVRVLVPVPVLVRVLVHLPDPGIKLADASDERIQV